MSDTQRSRATLSCNFVACLYRQLTIFCHQ